MVTKKKFGDYELYTISGGKLSVSISTLGATMTEISFLGKNMLLGYDTPEEYTPGRFSLNITVGRYANRIGGAKFTLNGKEYQLVPNERGNLLHGGPNSNGKRVWDAEIIGESVRFSIFSPDGDNGFPGNLTQTVTFSIEKGNTLQVLFGAQCDADTVFSPTVHPYFCFGSDESVLKAKLHLNSAEHIEVDDELIPTGNILPCEGRFDFSGTREIETDFDDAFVLKDEYALSITQGNVEMEMWTDLPAVQIYTGKGLKEPFAPNAGVAIEPEFFPDSPNHENFSCTTLKAGESFSRYVQYKFYEV